METALRVCVMKDNVFLSVANLRIAHLISEIVGVGVATTVVLVLGHALEVESA